MNFLDAVFEFLYPPKCIICEKLIADYGYCDDCNGKLKPISEHQCSQCGLDDKNCECKRRIYHFDAIAAPYFNEGYAKQGIYDLKFRRKFYCLRPFGKEMARVVKKNFGVENIDLVCCVPIKPESLYDRGFNQSDVLAREIAKNILLVDDIKTTGATIDECSRQLKFAGANKVYCVTALVTRRGESETSGL